MASTVTVCFAVLNGAGAETNLIACAGGVDWVREHAFTYIARRHPGMAAVEISLEEFHARTEAASC